MIAAENLDHQPQTVTLERLPDGTALLWLRKGIRQTTPQDETAPGWECSLVTVHLTATQAAQETEESVQTNFDAWWDYTPPSPDTSGPTPAERLAALEAENEMLTSCILELSQIVYS